MKECPIWYPGALWNVAENLLRFDNDNTALTCARESGELKHYTYKQLKSMVREMAAAMRAHGLQPGDRVAGTSFMQLSRSPVISMSLTVQSSGHHELHSCYRDSPRRLEYRRDLLEHRDGHGSFCWYPAASLASSS